jgi:superfamily II DNA helicase RecQ
MPRSLDEIKQISGFGDVKCQKYGVEILNIIDKYR